jgi:plastocyanin
MSLPHLSIPPVLFLVLLAGGCPPPGECATDTDCETGEVCRPLQETGETVCIEDVQPVADAGPVDEDPVAILTFTAAPNPVDSGATSTLSWTTEHATSCAVSPGVGAVDANGSVDVTPADNTRYTLSCQGFGGPALQSVDLDVNVEIVSFTADATDLNAGDTVTLSWEVRGATGCELAAFGSTAAVATDSLPTGSTSLTADETTSAALTCQGAGGPASDTVDLTVARILTFTATPVAVAAGDEVTLAWTVDSVTDCAVQDITDANTSDAEATVTVDTTTGYTLACTGFASTELLATVEVPVLINTFAADTNPVASGGNTDLNFTVSPDVASCTINSTDAPLETAFNTGALTVDTEFELVCQRDDAVSASKTLTVTIQ